MKILVNLSMLKRGGGQTVALNFVDVIPSINSEDVFYFAVCRNTELDEAVKRVVKSTQIIYLSHNPYIRIFQERTLLEYYLSKNHIDVVYTYFGYTNIDKRIPQVSGVADSNLFFPDIDFWEGYSGIVRLYKKMIDSYRVHGYKKADALIFENEAMMRQSTKILGEKKVTFIRPSVSGLPSKGKEEEKGAETKQETYIGLLLCGWQYNKNILKIPEVVYQVRRLGIDYRFYITTEKDKSAICKQFMRDVEKYNVEEYISLIGNVRKDSLRELYEKIDHVFLLSKLESFSNNIIEAWCYERPLLVADEEWSHSICKEGAIFVKRDDAKMIAETIADILHGDRASRVVHMGRRLLLQYPSPLEKACTEIEYVKSVFEEH